MDKVHNITSKEDDKTTDPIAFLKFKAKQIRESRVVKPVLVAVAFGVGAYLGARQPMRQISRDVHTMADRTKRIDHNLFTYAQQDLGMSADELVRRENLREDLARSHEQGLEFKYYPGLGIFYPNGDANRIDEPAPVKAKK